MSRCRVLNQADLDIGEIAESIAANNLSAAIRFLHCLRRDFELLSLFKNIGNPVARVRRRLKGLRAVPVRNYRNYLILFIPRPEYIDIVRVIHGARKLSKAIRES